MNESLNVGDEVTWMHTRVNGRSISMQTRRGKIEELYITANTKARVKWKGVLFWIPLKELRPANQRTALTEFVIGKP